VFELAPCRARCTAARGVGPQTHRVGPLICATEWDSPPASGCASYPLRTAWTPGSAWRGTSVADFDFVRPRRWPEARIIRGHRCCNGIIHCYSMQHILHFLCLSPGCGPRCRVGSRGAHRRLAEQPVQPWHRPVERWEFADAGRGDRHRGGLLTCPSRARWCRKSITKNWTTRRHALAADATIPPSHGQILLGGRPFSQPQESL
jgi:hypothetical protein